MIKILLVRHKATPLADDIRVSLNRCTIRSDYLKVTFSTIRPKFDPLIIVKALDILFAEFIERSPHNITV